MSFFPVLLARGGGRYRDGEGNGDEEDVSETSTLLPTASRASPPPPALQTGQRHEHGISGCTDEEEARGTELAFRTRETWHDMA